MRDTKLASLLKKKEKPEKQVPRFALPEEEIHDFIEREENIDTRAKTERDVSLLKNIFLKEGRAQGSY